MNRGYSRLFHLSYNSRQLRITYLIDYISKYCCIYTNYLIDIDKLHSSYFCYFACLILMLSIGSLSCAGLCWVFIMRKHLKHHKARWACLPLQALLPELLCSEKAAGVQGIKSALIACLIMIPALQGTSTCLRQQDRWCCDPRRTITAISSSSCLNPFALLFDCSLVTEAFHVSPYSPALSLCLLHDQLHCFLQQIAYWSAWKRWISLTGSQYFISLGLLRSEGWWNGFSPTLSSSHVKCDRGFLTQCATR